MMPQRREEQLLQSCFSYVCGVCGGENVCGLGAVRACGICVCALYGVSVYVVRRVCEYAVVCAGLKCSCHSSQCSPLCKKREGFSHRPARSPSIPKGGGGSVRQRLRLAPGGWQSQECLLGDAEGRGCSRSPGSLGGAALEPPVSQSPNAAFSVHSANTSSYLSDSYCVLGTMLSAFHLVFAHSDPLISILQPRDLSPRCGSLWANASQCC